MTDILAPLMFVVLFLMLVSGFPVAFALAANGLLFGWVAIELGMMKPALLQALPDRIFGIMSNETLLAIPFFTLMGLILERSGMAEELLETIGKLFGRVRGGLAFAVILVGALLAATTGVVAASVISMALISLPVMMKYGYRHSVATGVITASGTLAQIIPPSLVLIVLADQLSVSVGDMYKGAMLPALLLTSAYIAYIGILTVIRPQWVPALPREYCQFGDVAHKRPGLSLLIMLFAGVSIGLLVFHLLQSEDTLDADIQLTRAGHLAWSVVGGGSFVWVSTWLHDQLKLKWLSEMARAVIWVLMPPLALIFLVLGTIFIGLATPTEAGAMGATGALILAAAKGKLNKTLLLQSLDSTTRLSCFVMFILIGSTVFSLTFRAIEGDIWIEHLVSGLPGGQIGFILAVQILVFVLGCFLDFFEIAFIVIPLIIPVAQKLGIDPVWFGVMIGVNLQTSFLTPPFGFALFYLKSAAPKSLKTRDIYAGSINFVLIQLTMVAVLYAFPGLVLKEDSIAIENKPLELDLQNQGYGTDQYQDQ